MASIQQSLNQMLFSAQIGAGLYAQSPQAQERLKIKKENKQEAIYKRTLEDYQKTHEYLSPEELPGKEEKYRQRAEEAASGLAEIAQARYQRDPSEENWEASYLADVEADEYKRLGGSASFIESLRERSSNLQSQKQEISNRRQFLENPEQAPWQRDAFTARQAEESRIMAHNKPNAFIEQQNRELEEMRNGK